MWNGRALRSIVPTFPCRGRSVSDSQQGWGGSQFHPTSSRKSAKVLPCEGGIAKPSLAGHLQTQFSPPTFDGLVQLLHRIAEGVADFHVPDPNDSNSLTFDEGVPAPVVLLAIMMRCSVDFDGEAQCRTVEVEDVLAQRLLTPEPKAQLRVSKLLPQQLLRFRCALSQLSGATLRVFAMVAKRLHEPISPQGCAQEHRSHLPLAGEGL